MTFSSCITDKDAVLVLDTSVVINLLATGHATSILEALSIPIVVTDTVVREIEQGAISGRPESEFLTKMIGDRVLQVGELEGETLIEFFDLVSGSTSQSLDDGEAATLVFAQGNGYSAAIDEKKATRLAAERFASLSLVTTIDILAHETVRTFLGEALLADATFQALRLARMQIREHQFDWVARLIGPGNVEACSSLRRHARRASRQPRPQGVER